MQNKLDKRSFLYRIPRAPRYFHKLKMNDSTVSSAHPEYSIGIPYSFKVVSFVAISVVTLLSVFGNISVVISFLKTQNLRTSTNYYITSMAVSDRLFIATGWTLYSSSGVSAFVNSLSSFGCKIGTYCWYVSYSVSILSLVLITVDRFIAIVFPMKVTMLTKRARAIFILLTWLVPIGILFPLLYFAKLAEEPDGPYRSVLLVWVSWHLQVTPW